MLHKNRRSEVEYYLFRIDFAFNGFIFLNAFHAQSAFHALSTLSLSLTDRYVL